MIKLKIHNILLMPIWICTNCDMSMTLTENITNVSCPNCGKKMTQISE